MRKKLTNEEIALFRDAIAQTMNFESHRVEYHEVAASVDTTYSIYLTVWYKNGNQTDMFEHKVKILKLLRLFNMRGTNTLWGNTKERIGIYIPEDADLQAVCGLWLLKNYDNIIDVHTEIVDLT
jgi:hypothetical protein